MFGHGRCLVETLDDPVTDHILTTLLHDLTLSVVPTPIRSRWTTTVSEGEREGLWDGEEWRFMVPLT